MRVVWRPVRTAKPIAIARTVVGYLYLLSMASRANGMTAPDILEDAHKIPYAILLHSIQNFIHKAQHRVVEYQES